MRLTAATIALCLLPVLPLAAGEGHDDHDDHDHADDAHLSEKAGVRLLHPWGVMQGGALHVYVEIENGAEQEVIVTGGDSADGDLMLVATDPASGQAEAIGAMPVAAGREMDFAPDELFLRLDNAPDLHEGDHYDAHIGIEPLGEIEVEIEIYAPGTTEHPHAGHNH